MTITWFLSVVNGMKTTHKIIIFGLVLLLLCSSLGLASDSEVPTDDAHTRENAAATPHPSSTVGYTQTRTSINNRAYFAFDLSGREDMNQAYFNVYQNSISGAHADVSIEFYFCTSTFDEDTLTWNNQDTTVTGCEGSPFKSALSTAFGAGSYYNTSVNLSSRINTDSDKKFTIKIVEQV